MSLIQISNLTFSYDGSYDDIFDHVSFQIDTNWKLGFIGRNGKGKTTFLNLLMGKYEYFGTISSDVSFEYFPFPVADPQSDTLSQLRLVGGDFEEWELRRELSILEVDEGTLYRPFCTLSNGEQTKLLLASLFLKENRFLLIDEPTNHLDAKARKLVSQYLSDKKGYILVSHDRDFLDHCVDHILSINRTNIEVQKGNFSSWWENKQRQDQFEIAENEKRKKDIKRLSEAAKRAAEWAERSERSKIGIDPSIKQNGLRPYLGEKSRKMMKRSKTIEARREHAINEKSKLLHNLEETELLKLSPISYHKQQLVSLKDITITYDSRQICRPLSFTIEQGDRIALCGKNGAGKSSILKLIRRESILHDGTLTIGSGLILSYLPQDSSFLCGSLHDFIKAYQLDESLFKAILRKLDFSRVQFEKQMEDLSAGQKKKVLLAKSLCERAHLYLWDEPLNYIDIFSRMQIESLLDNYRPTILFVEHDKAFTDKIANKIIMMD